MNRPPIRGDVGFDDPEFDDDWDDEDDDAGYEYEELRTGGGFGPQARRRPPDRAHPGRAGRRGAVLWVRSQLDPSGEPGEAVRLSIPTGSTTSDIARILDDAGVIPDAQAFRVLPAVQGRGVLPGRRLRVPGELGGLGRPRRAAGRPAAAGLRPVHRPRGTDDRPDPGRAGRRRRRLRRGQAGRADLHRPGAAGDAAARGHQPGGVPVPRHLPGRGRPGRARRPQPHGPAVRRASPPRSASPRAQPGSG